MVFIMNTIPSNPGYYWVWSAEDVNRDEPTEIVYLLDNWGVRRLGLDGIGDVSEWARWEAVCGPLSFQMHGVVNG
jgi:hypothetical protein